MTKNEREEHRERWVTENAETVVRERDAKQHDRNFLIAICVGVVIILALLMLILHLENKARSFNANATNSAAEQEITSLEPIIEEMESGQVVQIRFKLRGDIWGDPGMRNTAFADTLAFALDEVGKKHLIKQVIMPQGKLDFEYNRYTEVCSITSVIVIVDPKPGNPESP